MPTPSAEEDEPKGPFHDALEIAGWLILRGGLDVQAFIALKPGPEREFLLGAMTRAEQRRQIEVQQHAAYVGRAMGGGSNVGST